MEEGRRRALKKVAAVIVVAAVVGTVLWVVWDVYVRPRTIREVMEMTRLQPGTQIELEGTVTGMWRENTSYGPRVELELDGYREACPVFLGGGSPTVFGDPSVEYRIGGRFRTTLHMLAYRFNGDPGVWAPELACPFPNLFRVMGYLWDAVSMVSGFALTYRGTAADGWSTYEVYTSSGDVFRADVLPVTLRKATSFLDPGLSISGAAQWIVVAAVEYVRITGMFHSSPIIDSMASLASPAANDTIRFVDSNGDALVGDGDLLQVRLPDTGGETSYETYLLQVGSVNASFAAYAAGGHYIFNGPRGPYEGLTSPPDYELPQLRHVGDQIGPRVTSTLEVSRVRFGLPQPISDLRFGLIVNATPGFQGNVSDLPQVLPNGLTVAFTDTNRTGFLDTGDRFVIGNLENRTSASFSIDHAKVTMSSSTWIAGYGHVVGRHPEFTLAAQGAGPYRVDTSAAFWHPEFALNRTLRVSLWENSSLVLDDLPLANGTVGTFPNGSLAFSDGNGDGFLSAGDSFLLQGAPGARYQLRVSLLFGTVQKSVVVGP